jgi:hypothetical protein
MGQSKQRKARLGEWYGKSIGPGHPDFVPPKLPKPLRPLVRFVPEGSEDEPITIDAERVTFFAEDGRIEVERTFSGCYEPIGVWFSGNGCKGILLTGSSERRVELVEVDAHRAIFKWLRDVEEEPTESKPTEAPLPEERTQEEPPTSRPGPRRPARNMAFLSMVFGLAAMSAPMFGPEPDHRPRKKY